MDEQFQPLKKGEVISVDDSAQILIGHRTFKVGEFAESIRTQLEYGLGGSGWTEEKDSWFSDNGINCEVLRFGADGWQKGKVRISLEFCPEEPRPADPVAETPEYEEDSDFADILASPQDESEFPELSADNDLEDFQPDSLLDDVWQDMNQGISEENEY